MMQDKIKAAFRLNGGLGTYLMEENFIQYFYDAFPDLLSITVYGENSTAINEGIFRGQYFIDQYFPRSMFRSDGYDLVVDINWFPKVMKADVKKIRAASARMGTVVDSWISFCNDPDLRHLAEISSLYDPNIYTYAIARGQTRLTVCDIGGHLGVRRDYRLKIGINEDEAQVLQRFGLTSGNYITMQQGVNSKCRTSDSPRQWPNGYYGEFCRIMKGYFPDIVLVQLGELDNNRPIDGIDRCLLGETGFEELKVLLKHARVHIDGDCGMVHLRKALHGGTSVVLYGQTSAQVLGYDDDINLTSHACKHWCGKTFDAWKRRCFIADKPLCMEAITPQHVADTVKAHLLGTYVEPKKQTVLQRLLADPTIKLDPEWVDNWLGQRTIHAYWLEKVKIRDLAGFKLTSGGYVRVPIQEMPAYEYLLGDRQCYVDYMALNDQYNPGHEHSVERFEALIDSFHRGLDEQYYPAVDGTDRILDGAHRACWLAYQKGLDAEITVLKLYGDWRL